MTTREMAAFNMGILSTMLLLTFTDELAMNTTAWYVLHCGETEMYPITVAEAREGKFCSNGAGIEPLKDTEARLTLAKYQVELVWAQTKEKLGLTEK